MIDHLAIEVSHLEQSIAFYDKALQQLGYKRLSDTPQEFGGRRTMGWSDSSERDFYIAEGSSTTPRLHIAFRASQRDQVNAFHAAAL